MLLPVLDKPKTTDSYCEDCGACCMRVTVPPYTVYEILHLPDELREEVSGLLLIGHRPGTQCSWFDPETRLCKHYEDRPSTCVAFKSESSACKYARDRELI